MNRLRSLDRVRRPRMCVNITTFSASDTTATHIWIEDREPVLAIGVQASKELAAFVDAIVCVVGKDTVEVQVVEIAHDALQLNLSLGIQINDILQICPVKVSPSLN